jgi:hypothetical protein
MIAVAWLVLWVAMENSKATGIWWPFAMRTGQNKPSPDTESDVSVNKRMQTNRRQVPARPWRRSGS